MPFFTALVKQTWLLRAADVRAWLVTDLCELYASAQTARPQQVTMQPFHSGWA